SGQSILRDVNRVAGHRHLRWIGLVESHWSPEARDRALIAEIRAILVVASDRRSVAPVTGIGADLGPVGIEYDAGKVSKIIVRGVYGALARNRSIVDRDIETVRSLHGGPLCAARARLNRDAVVLACHDQSLTHRIIGSFVNLEGREVSVHALPVAAVGLR